MGAQANDMNSNNYDKDAFTVESPVHKVTLSEFYICAYEVTQEQWIASMGSNPSISQLGGKYPIENVSWEDVQLFISKLCEASGKTYRLPTEAEWEYAAKGGNRQDIFLFSGSNVPSSVGWFYSNSNSSIHEIGLKDPNILGIYDMTGNVSEWVSDWFKSYESSDINNPVGSSYGELKINRGGSCNTASKNCRNTYRNMNSPSYKSGDIGFRLVLVQ
ncbi:MAG: formylglycine-generating enzyme family protein [Lachnospiraceae bacterium]|nr:formylglycine-generating enzyme family protein [Lachnospiraceae bacterium]